MCFESDEHYWTPLSSLLKDSDEKIALIHLNTPIGKETDKYKTLWDKACLKAVVDGAVNELHKINKSQEYGKQFIPDLISGDFDSVEKDLLEHYKKLGVEVVPTPDQNATDFTKALKLVIRKILVNNLKVSCIAVYVSFSGRLDHILANINTLFTAHRLTHIPVYLINTEAVACLLPTGRHVISVDSGLEGDWCGLIPIGHRCDHVTTSGLKWNLNDDPMEFGGIVSTSNKLDGNSVVKVSTDNPLLWTVGIKEGRKD